MLIIKEKAFVFALLTILLFFGLTFSDKAFAKSNHVMVKRSELRECVREFRKLLHERGKIASNESIDRAKQLDRQSQKAASAGRVAEAVSLLEQAIAILEKIPEALIKEKGLPQKMHSTAREIARRVLSAQDVLPEVENGRAMDYFDSPFGFIDDVAQEPYLGQLNVHWRRGTQAGRWGWIETKKGMYDWSIPDHHFLASFKNGVNIALEIRVHNKIYGAVLGHEYPDGNTRALSEFVRKLVERYDGDGIDDAPGSPVIKLYQFIHELSPPLRRDRTSQRRIEYYRSNVDQYIELFQVIYRAMKEACPDAKLMLAGTTKIIDFSFKGDTISNPRGSLISIDEDGFLVRVLHGLNRSCKDIALDYHIWVKAKGSGYKMHRNFIKEIRRCCKKLGYKDIDIMSMEAGTADYMDGATEKDQATSLIKIYVSTLALGQKKLFWTTASEYDWSTGDTSLFDFTGLVNNHRNKDGKSHKKLAFFTYKLMVEKLEGSDWDNIETVIDGTDNVYIYRFTKKDTGKPVYVAWWDYFEEKSHVGKAPKSLILKVGNVNKVRITDSITDANGKRKVWEKDVDHVKVELLFSETPLFIEPLP